VGFVCSVCGEHHAERLMDVRFGLPDAIYALSEAERRERASIGDDSAVLDDELHFVRGLVEIPVPELGDRFAFGAWAAVDREDWYALGELWADPQQAEAPPFPGRLANELGPYEATNGLPVVVRLRSLDLVPALILEDGEHPLVRDQRVGITAAKSERLADRVLHAEAV
jgi:hypothetical protein